MYGFPNEEAERLVSLGEYVYGGCCIEGEPMCYRCTNCAYEWRPIPRISTLRLERAASLLELYQLAHQTWGLTSSETPFPAFEEFRNGSTDPAYLSRLAKVICPRRVEKFVQKGLHLAAQKD